MNVYTFLFLINNAALLSIRDFLQKYKKIILSPNFQTVYYYIY